MLDTLPISCLGTQVGMYENEYIGVYISMYGNEYISMYIPMYVDIGIHHMLLTCHHFSHHT